ncbi:uncharacterized protein LOC116415891 isoform X1 [Nasonia vitripennis]|uniref:Uncharacterized protein n=1 Tax=Nasonia vitripennis TaxID=7425 RepID=A0A7M7PWX8_NASVI|nr:uncharacterized protein LOC116415891 isoform X1 [Nasonia vitripennis]
MSNIFIDNMDLIVVIQGFKGQNGEFIVKELAYIDPNEPAAVAQLATFQPPHSWYDLSSDVQCANLWLKYSFHGLKWSDGEQPYDKLAEVCSSLLDLSPTRNVIIWVKGAQKKEWLQLYFPDVRNIEDLGCPSLKIPGFRTPLVCSHYLPDWKENCAVQNVYAINKWLRAVRQDFIFPLHFFEDYYSSSDSDTTTTTLEE